MQQPDMKQNLTPTSAQSDFPTTAETNRHSLLPPRVDDRNDFAFDVYSLVPCKATGNKLEWDNVPWEGHGRASRDPTGQIKWKWKGPTTFDGEMSETSLIKTSHDPHATLREETSVDGLQSRYVQNFGQWDSKLTNKKDFPHIVDKLLVGRWFNNPAPSFPSSQSSAEKDADRKESSAKKEGGKPVDEEWFEVPGHRWGMVHETGNAEEDYRSFWSGISAGGHPGLGQQRRRELSGWEQASHHSASWK